MNRVMRNLFFNIVARITYSLIRVVDVFLGWPAAFLQLLTDSTRTTIAVAGVSLMTTIDPAQAKAVESEASTEPGELESQGMELKLLQAAYRVRDNAVETGDWTEDHTEAIEAIGTALLLEMGWEEEFVHNHLKSVVETIDGLQYDVLDSEEE